MWGPPEDVPGECNAHIYIADDYGDNHATCRCNKPKGHEGKHIHTFEREGHIVEVIWVVNEKER